MAFEAITIYFAHFSVLELDGDLLQASVLKLEPTAWIVLVAALNHYLLPLRVFSAPNYLQ